MQIRINGVLLSETHEDLLMAHLELCYEALGRAREVTVGTFNAAKLLIDAISDELLRRWGE